MTEKIKPAIDQPTNGRGKPRSRAGAVNLAPPFIRSARPPADSVKIGLNNPLTGTYAALGTNELIGAQFAVEQMNGQGRHSWTSGRVAVRGLDQRRWPARRSRRTRKLIERDGVNFILGNVNSALSLRHGRR